MKPRNVILVVLGVAVLGGVYLAMRPEPATAPVQTIEQVREQSPAAPAAPAPVVQPQEERDIPVYHASAKEARPLPTTLSPNLFAAIPVVARAYRIAKRIPGVLAQQPCYCHCDRMGHVGLLDCYRSDHGAG